jgi:tryptophan-rich sensory protein
MWLLLAYLLWQAVAVITGVSLWNWRRSGAS